MQNLTSKQLHKVFKEDGLLVTDEELQSVQRNDPVALQAIGNKYHMQQNYVKSMEWYLHSASVNNNPHAQCMIGLQYMMGQGVAIDYKKTMEWHLKAANQGIATAQYRVGKLTELGHGVERASKQDALEWYHRSISNGHKDAEKDILQLNMEGYFLTAEQAAVLSMENRIQQYEQLCQETENENKALNLAIEQVEQTYQRSNEIHKALEKEKKKQKKQKKKYEEDQLALFALLLVRLMDKGLKDRN